MRVVLMQRYECRVVIIVSRNKYTLLLTLLPCLFIIYFVLILVSNYTAWNEGRGGVVSVATGYGLDGPVIESRRGQDFLHRYRLALGPIKWVLGKTARVWR